MLSAVGEHSLAFQCTHLGSSMGHTLLAVTAPRLHEEVAVDSLGTQIVEEVDEHVVDQVDEHMAGEVDDGKSSSSFSSIAGVHGSLSSAPLPSWGKNVKTSVRANSAQHISSTVSLLDPCHPPALYTSFLHEGGGVGCGQAKWGDIV